MAINENQLLLSASNFYLNEKKFEKLFQCFSLFGFIHFFGEENKDVFISD